MGKVMDLLTKDISAQRLAKTKKWATKKYFKIINTCDELKF